MRLGIIRSESVENIDENSLVTRLSSCGVGCNLIRLIVVMNKEITLRIPVIKLYIIANTGN